MKTVMVGKQQFIMMTAAESLKQEGFETVIAGADAKSFTGARDGASVAILFLDPEMVGDEELMSALRDYKNDGGHIFAYGDDEDLSECGYRLGNALEDRFKRPLDVAGLAEALFNLSDADRSARKFILLVDDDPDYLKMLGDWLAKKYRIALANSGMQALAFLGEHRPDLILLDYSMPGTSGVQLLEMIKDDPSTKDIPVVFLTGMADRENVEDALSLKPDGYILKSTKYQALLDTIDGIIGNH